MSIQTKRSLYWRRTLRISMFLLSVWLVVTLGVGLFAADWQFSLFGWPFGFWMASQGALGIYCVIVWVYAWLMDRLDEAHGEITGD